MNGKLAYSIDELAHAGPIGRTKLFEHIREGRLPAKKDGNRTIVLSEDYQKFLRSLPNANLNSPQA